MIPPCMPTSSRAARTVSVASANGGRPGKIRPNKPLSAGTPGPSRPPCTADPAVLARALPATPGNTPADAASSPAPAAPVPASNRRRDGPDRV